MSRRPDLAGMGGEALHTVYLIARREFTTRVRSRFFVVGTAILMIAVAGYIVLQAEVFNKATTTVKVGFTASAQALAKPLRAAAGGATGITVQTSNVANESTGRSEVTAGTLDALVSGDPAGPYVAVKDTLNPTVEATLDSLVKQVALTRALTASGANAAAVETAVGSASIHLVVLDPNATQRTERTVVGIFVAALLYVALVAYGQLVASGVVEEKANRIVEILMATVRPRQMLFGKVIGIGLMGFLQLVLVGTVAFVALNRTQAISVPSLGLDAVAAGLFWFVLGFLFYALLYAAGGSMVSRQEDIASVTVPLTMLIVGTYLAFFWVVANPDNPLAAVLSVLPPLAPILMPARMATGDAQAWQVALAIVLVVLGIAGVNWLAARIYTNSVLRVGTRVKFIQAWRGGD